MAKYYNRGGMIWDFDPTDPKTLARVANGELRPVEEVDVPAPAEEPKDLSTADERNSKSMPPSDFTGMPLQYPEGEPIAEEDQGVPSADLTDQEKLAVAHADYEMKFDKQVSRRYKNDIEWILSKLA